MALDMLEPLILASASPRRQELLGLVGISFEVLPSQIEEAALHQEEPAVHVLRLAEEKARCAARQRPRSWVLGADTIVVIEGTILGKPAGRDEAREMLRRLSGQTHTVFTGFCLLNEETRTAMSRAVTALVCFRQLADDEIAWYLQTPEPYDKAGAYAVQGKGAFFIREIQGSYTNVMGLPLCEVVDALKTLGIIAFAQIRKGNEP
jgi:septum formation protein